MESRMVNDEFQNKFGITSEKAIKYIKEKFKTDLVKFSLIDEYDKIVHFETSYKCNNNIIKIGGGRGCLELSINLNGEEYYLFDYYIISVDYIVVNENNLDIVFKLLLEFLKEMKVI